MPDSLEEIGLSAVDRFLVTWNSRDPQAWASSLNFPHVRPSPFGNIIVAGDAEDYISRVDYSRVEQTGWDHSEWDYRQVIHMSTAKIHVAGQWTRYNAEGEKILTTPIVYVVTLADSEWGIQSRFGSDYAGEDDTTSLEGRAFKLIELFVLHSNNRNQEAAASVLNFPHFSIGNGALTESPAPSDFVLPEANISVNSMIAIQAGRRSVNVAIEVTTGTQQGESALQGVINVTERDDHLGIQAWSFLNPDDETEQ